MLTAAVLSLDLKSALVVVVEISQTAWVIAAHIPGLEHVKVRRRIEPHGETLRDATREGGQRGGQRR